MGDSATTSPPCSAYNSGGTRNSSLRLPRRIDSQPETLQPDWLSRPPTLVDRCTTVIVDPPPPRRYSFSLLIIFLSRVDCGCSSP